MGKSSGGGGKASDVVGAARETGEQARMLNEQQTWANRPDQNNAWGSTSWNQTPQWDATTGQYINTWEQTESLNPKLQEAVDAQQNVQLGRSNLAQGQMGRVWDDQSQRMDFDQYGDPLEMADSENIEFSGWEAGSMGQAAEDAAYQKSMNRLDPQFDSERGALETRLRNQGLTQGDRAYDNAMSNFGTGRNDAYEQARLGATSEGRDASNLMYNQYLGSMGFNNAAQQQQFGQNAQQNQISNALRSQNIEEDLFKRGFSLDEMNRMQAGQQISGGPPTSGGETGTIAGKTLGG